MDRPFRFGVQFTTLSADWRSVVTRSESAGGTRFTFHDHLFAAQDGPFAALGALAGAVSSAGVETNVLDLNHWNPVVVAREAATLARLAPGGCDLGTGAGWNPQDAAMAGVPFPPASERLGRLREFAEIVKGCWAGSEASYEGRFYSCAGPVALPLDPGSVPRLLLGATRPRALALAGELADVVSIYATLGPELDWPGWAEASSYGSFHAKAELALASAARHGRDLGGIDLHTVTSFVAVADRPDELVRQACEISGLEPDAMRHSLMFLVGTPAEAKEELLRRRAETGINHYVFQPFQLGDEPAFLTFAEEVLAPLAAA
jgi:alkanesulfonate monooxygenase SsuD/methylene tetrahydromethanopterin reductase-like flavin-dependent oxidoreductase (luciferase family)